MSQHFTTTSPCLDQAKMGDDYFSSVLHEADNQLIHLVDWILDRLESSRDRAALAHMDCRELKDIGLTRSDIERVAGARRRPAV